MTMSKVDIINDTVNYYCDHKRAVNDKGACVYFDASIKARCAIGRFSASEKLDNFEGDITAFVEEIAVPEDKVLDDYLVPEVHGHDPGFWYDVQSLHDFTTFWVKQEGVGKALTDEGQREYERLLATYGKKQGS